MTKPLALTDLQLDVLATLAGENTRLRWHSYQTPAKAGDRGRGQILGCESKFNETCIPAYCVRSLIRRGLIAPASRIERQPFRHGVTHRDYVITDVGRRSMENAR